MNQIIQETLDKNKENYNNYKNKIINKLKNKRKNLNVEISDEIFEIHYNSNFIIPVKQNKFQQIKDFIIKKKYQLQFIFSSIIAGVFLVFLFLKLYKNNEQEKISKDLLKSYQLTTLYSDSSVYNSSEMNSNILLKNPFVIGMIKIDKLSLTYPILSESNNDLLKISVCKFTGPMPNEIGNLCIAGHNYIDNNFFSNLNELEIGDNIEIYGLSGQKQNYEVFKKYEVNYDDLSCTSQNVGNDRIITLLTCDNINNNKRLIVQAKNI